MLSHLLGRDAVEIYRILRNHTIVVCQLPAICFAYGLFVNEDKTEGGYEEISDIVNSVAGDAKRSKR